MFLYIDSLFSEGREGTASPLESIPDTLSGLYLQAMQAHDRKAVLLHRSGGRWEFTPDWRFDRQVIRLGLYLRERLGIEPSDRVAIISEPRPEWFLADFAAVALGALSTGICSSEAGGVESALADAGPRVVLVSASVMRSLHIVPSDFPSVEHWVAFDAPAPDGSVEFHSALDLGGTLDTPERAQSFRAQAREWTPEDTAIRHYHGSTNGIAPYIEMTHGETIDRVRRQALEQPARAGDVVYAAASEITLDLRLAFYGFIGDGYSTATIGQPDDSPQQLRELRPHRILAPARAIAAAIAGGEDRSTGEARELRGWRRLASRIRPRARADGVGGATRNALGGRVRWVGATTPLDPNLATKLRAAQITIQDWANESPIETAI